VGLIFYAQDILAPCSIYQKLAGKLDTNLNLKGKIEKENRPNQ